MQARAQDPIKVAPHIYSTRLENERVRVLEVRMKPGGRSEMHSHPAYVIYALGDTAKVKFTDPGGAAVDVELKPGDVMWREPEEHAVDNVGNTDAHVLLVELK